MQFFLMQTKAKGFTGVCDGKGRGIRIHKNPHPLTLRQTLNQY